MYWNKNGTPIAIKGETPDSTSRYWLSDPTLIGNAGNVSLVIENVTRWDAGSYTCGVNDESTGGVIIRKDVCELTVYYLDKPTLSTLGPLEVARGSKVEMSCVLNEAFPTPIKITWFYGNMMLEENQNDTVLEIGLFNESDAGNYSCKVENGGLFGENGKPSNYLTFWLKKGPIEKEAVAKNQTNISTTVNSSTTTVAVLKFVTESDACPHKGRCIQTK
ncbi:cell adhesion molecule CEACAM6-like [Antedon mediterranea]|uniref:cell adhesion molecule CEACAM6-like n=1 Tax=Antedon mediterranea TaxID=105859 RepID=UPI003AF4E456